MVNDQVAAPDIVQGAGSKVSGMLSSLKSFFKPEVIAAKFNEWKGSLLDWGVYLAIGFFAGFLIKKYVKYILLLILFVVALILLEQFDILHTMINWQKMQELFNIKDATGAFDAHAIQSYIDWGKANFALVLSTSIGFILGVRVG